MIQHEALAGEQLRYGFTERSCKTLLFKIGFILIYLYKYSREKPMVKITDVAKKANVSISTVSRVLNNTTFVNDELRTKVLNACKELNYKPNFFASNLSGHSTKIIGLIHNAKPDYATFKRDLYFNQSCNLEASILGNHLCIFYIEDIDETGDMLNFGRMPIDGAILSGPKLDGISENSCQKEHVPFIVIGNPVNSSAPFINADNVNVVKSITSSLIKAYGREVYLLNSEKEITISEERYEAFAEICKKHNINPNKNHFNIKDSKDILTNERIKTKIQRNTAFLVADEKMARTLYDLIKEKGLIIGDDVGVFSLGIQDEHELFEPNLSYAMQDYVSIGKLAVDMLLKLINGKKVKNTIVDSKVIISDSTSRLLK